MSFSNIVNADFRNEARKLRNSGRFATAGREVRNMKKAEQIKLEDIIRVLKEHKEELAEKYNVKEIGVFGSYVRDEQKAGSDIDILVEFYEAPSLLRFINLENYLSDLLGMKVDLVMKKALKRNIGEEILREVIPI